VNRASALLFGSQTNLCGRTAHGGNGDVCDRGCGTGLEPSAQNGSWSDTVLYNSCSLSDCTHGLVPTQGQLVRDARAASSFKLNPSGNGMRVCSITLREEQTAEGGSQD
jgi:hypothetical protein